MQNDLLSLKDLIYDLNVKVHICSQKESSSLEISITFSH